MERTQRATIEEDPTNNGTQPQRPKNSDNLLSAHSESTAKMSDVADLTDRVVNVSLDEVSSPGPSDTDSVVSNTNNPLPQREVRVKLRTARSATSFVSYPSTPCDSVTTVPKFTRPINSYFTPVTKIPIPTGKATTVTSKDKDSTTQSRPDTPNILEGLIIDEDAIASNPPMTSSKETSIEDVRGAKRKRIVSAASNNYQVVSQPTPTKNNPMQSLDMDEMSKQLFIESGRPAITVTSKVSDNRSTDANALSVSFQIPAQTPDQGAETDDDLDHITPIDLKKIQVDPGTPWMKHIEQSYYNTARSSVVAEVRAKHRSQMLCDLTNSEIIAPWALLLAPMPVYLHPHAAKVADIMKKQALDFQLKIADLLHDEAVFQAEKVNVDRASLQGIFGENVEGYRLSIGALFDARQKVQASIKDQMGKYADHMVKTENQASEKDLISMVKGSVPTQYSYAANLEQPTSMDPPRTLTKLSCVVSVMSVYC